jgi:hypothetical protein
MPRPTFPLCLALLSLALLARVTPAVAQTEIHRCIGANGGAVFTDQPCAALQATPVSPAAAAANSSAGAAPPPTLCAASVDGLRQSVIDAFAGRDANRLAGLILWDGYGRGAAIADIRALATLMKQPLLGIDTPPAAPTSTHAGSDDPVLPAARSEVPPPADQLVLRTADNDADGNPAAWRFDIVREAGCLWLRNAN